MDPKTTPLTRYADTLPSEWKWEATFVPPTPFEAEWRQWLAQAQRAEEMALLRYWTSRSQRAA
ncbi:MAG TPA: hypothetical protein VI316_06465 [Candidatus Dormibacteraeota bacterium]